MTEKTLENFSEKDDSIRDTLMTSILSKISLLNPIYSTENATVGRIFLLLGRTKAKGTQKGSTLQHV